MAIAIFCIFIMAGCSLITSLLLLNKYNKHNHKFHGYNHAKKFFKRKGLYKGIVAFGSARLKPSDGDIKEIEEISELCAKRILKKKKKISFITGGGPGVMTAWLKPAFKLGAQTAGFCIKLPREQKTNEYCKIHYDFTNFPSRKETFFDYAMCYVVFKGGFGTMDELFNLLCFIQTKKVEKRPIFIYPASYYKNICDFSNFINKKTINKEDAELITYCETKEELIKNLYKVIDNYK